jgi:hypothetical protein
MGGDRRAVGPQTGGDRRIAVRRAVRGCGALVGGLAGIASDVSFTTKPCEAILGSPYSIARLGGTLALPMRALVQLRICADRRGGSSHPLRGARWGRGRPESPARPSRCLNRLWRCRPARPPTSRNTPLRDAPRCVDPHPPAAPRRVDSHPVEPTPTADSHPTPAPKDVMDGKPCLAHIAR